MRRQVLWSDIPIFLPYPFKEYTVLANDKNRLVGGGQGGANCTVYNTISSYYILVHEIGHGWFGSMAGPAEGREDGWRKVELATVSLLWGREGTTSGST